MSIAPVLSDDYNHIVSACTSHMNKVASVAILGSNLQLSNQKLDQWKVLVYVTCFRPSNMTTRGSHM